MGDNLLVFIYDTTGAPIGMKYLNTADSTAVWETYWFEKNLFGDIVAVYNSSGTKLVSYLYDAWGNQTITTHVSGTAAQYNPFRYRGYYYDADFGLYYLQSRYYDSMSYRFINADGIEYLGSAGIISYNLYAYCNNNPISYVDPTGHSLFGLLTQLLVSVVSYIGISLASIFDEEIRSDMEAIGWNPFNEDTALVANSNKVSFYKGTPVFRMDFKRSGSFVGIFLSRSIDKEEAETVIKHEYGHCVQQMILGPIKYGLMIFLPSAAEWSNRPYYERPWEVTADLFGGVEERTHTDENTRRGIGYLITSDILGPLGYLYLVEEFR